MEKLTSILAIVDPNNETSRMLSKALWLARRFGASLELFLIDPHRAYALKHASLAQSLQRVTQACPAEMVRVVAPAAVLQDSKEVERARRTYYADAYAYLEALKLSVQTDDVTISCDVADDSDAHEAILRKVRASQPDLIVKEASGAHPMRALSWGDNDWRLARSCPATLMLTRHREWAQSPRFAAAIDVTEGSMCQLARTILRTAEYLASGCHAELETLYSEPERNGDLEHLQRRSRLQRLAREHQIDAQHTRLLTGVAEDVLPRYAAQQTFDVWIIGALTRKRGLSALTGTLTSKLVDAVDCDVVLVKPETSESAQAETARAYLG
jgi:universal stress protein E